MSHMLQLWTLPVHRGLPHHPRPWQLGIARGATSSIPVPRYHGADMFDFACDEVHVCPELEVFHLSGTIAES